MYLFRFLFFIKKHSCGGDWRVLWRLYSMLMYYLYYIIFSRNVNRFLIYFALHL